MPYTLLLLLYLVLDLSISSNTTITAKILLIVTCPAFSSLWENSRSNCSFSLVDSFSVFSQGYAQDPSENWCPDVRKHKAYV